MSLQAQYFSIRQAVNTINMSGIRKVFVSGKDAYCFLNHLITKGCSKIISGSAVSTSVLDVAGNHH